MQNDKITINCNCLHCTKIIFSSDVPNTLNENIKDNTIQSFEICDDCFKQFKKDKATFLVEGAIPVDFPKDKEITLSDVLVFGKAKVVPFTFIQKMFDTSLQYIHIFIVPIGYIDILNEKLKTN